MRRFIAISLLTLCIAHFLNARLPQPGSPLQPPLKRGGCSEAVILNSQFSIQIRGQVVADGRPLQGVAVTDGYNIVHTDQSGHYSLTSPVGARFVYVSTPAGYLPSVSQGTIPTFYQLIVEGQATYDFSLTRNPLNDTHHTLIVQADAQVTSVADLDQYEAMLTDIQATRQSLAGRDVLGLDCGDIVGDSPWLFKDYVKRVARLDMPIYRAIGNHDMDYNGRSHETSHHTFEDYFGPDHYSFNRGKVHYIVINDNFYIGREYFTWATAMRRHSDGWSRTCAMCRRAVWWWWRCTFPHASHRSNSRLPTSMAPSPTRWSMPPRFTTS